MIYKYFDDIDRSDIDSLIANEVPEGRQIDYKESLTHPKDKDEFRKDVAAMANSEGGYIIYGIKEKRDSQNKPTGIPEEAQGINANCDAETLSMESIIRDSISPRIIGIKTKAIAGFPQGSIIILYIPKSFNAPHMTKQASTHFYFRNSAGSHPMDITEIRNAFAISESLQDKIKGFRDQRITKILHDETPVPLQLGAKMILHIVPMNLSPLTQIDIHNKECHLSPMRSSGWSRRYNFDGIVEFTLNTQNISESYCQLFRNGAIESLCVFDERENKEKYIPSIWYEQEIIKCLKQYLKSLKIQQVLPPLWVMLSFTGVKDYQLPAQRGRGFYTDRYPIDRDILLLPEVMIEDYNTKPEDFMRPIFDAVWQSAGWERSLNYDQDNKWKAHS